MSLPCPGALERWLLGLNPSLRMRLGVRDTRALGRLGESFAEVRLRRMGARVLGRRLRTPRGELDLVVELQGRIVGVEVKASRVPGPSAVEPWRTWRPGRRLSEPGIRRRRGAIAWILGRTGVRDRRPRLDLFEVWVFPGPPWIQGVHHPDLTARLPRGAPTGAPS